MDMGKIRELIKEFVEAELTSFKYDEGNLHIEMTRDLNGYVGVSHQEGDDSGYFLHEPEAYTDADYDDDEDDEYEYYDDEDEYEDDLDDEYDDEYDDYDYDKDDEDDFY